MSDTVELPRWMVLSGGLALVAAISTSAFLLGRSTAPAPASSTATLPVAAAPRSDAPEPPTTETDAPTPAPAVSTAVAHAPARQTPRQDRNEAPAAADPLAPPASTRLQAPATPSEPTADASTTAAVRSYFETLDRIGAPNAGNTDPNVLIQQAMGGDVSGIDRLIEDHQRRQRAIQRLAPPAPCAPHHTSLTQLAGDGLAVMEQLRKGIATNDINALMTLQGRAVRLQALGEKVSRMEATLKNQYGLP